MISQITHTRAHTHGSRINASCIFMAFSVFPIRAAGRPPCAACVSLLYESFMLFSSQLFGRIWFGEARAWPNGEATWQLQMFCFCIAELIKNNKCCHPGVDAIWEPADSSPSSPLPNVWTALFNRYFVSNPPYRRLLVNAAYQTTKLSVSVRKIGIQKTPVLRPRLFVGPVFVKRREAI